MDHIKKILFWQPKKDLLDWFESTPFRQKVLIISNYIIWIFFFYISYLLVKKDTNVFWQILIATIVAEFIERFLKSKIYWRRPLFIRKNKTPVGLVDKWYQTGSFPSGHTLKTIYFLLFILQYQVFSPALFLAVTVPLLSFRILVGFHYPVDILGGAFTGAIVWLLSKSILFPESFNKIVRTIFNFVFGI